MKAARAAVDKSLLPTRADALAGSAMRSARSLFQISSSVPMPKPPVLTATQPADISGQRRRGRKTRLVRQHRDHPDHGPDFPSP